MKRHLPLLIIATAAACECAEETRIAVSRLEVTPTVVDFGAVPMGTTDVRELAVRSTGAGAVNFDSVGLTDGGEARGFELANVLTETCSGDERGNPKQLAGGECARIVVKFRPKTAGVSSTRLRIISDDQERPSIDVEIRGEAQPSVVGACLIDAEGQPIEGACTATSEDGTFSVPTIDFGEVPRRSTARRTLRVSSLGRGTLGVAGIAPAGGSVGFTTPSEAPVTEIPGGAHADVVVEFTPPAKGEFTGTLVVATDDVDHPRLEVPLRGVGTAPAAKLCVLGVDGAVDEAACTRLGEEPPFKPVVELPQTPLGAEVTRTVRLINTDKAPLVVKSFELQSTTPELYVPVPAEPTTLPADGTLDLTVAFLPRHEGVAAGILALMSDDDAHPRIELEVKALATSAVVRVCVLREDGSESQEGCSRLRDTPPFTPDVDFGPLGLGSRLARTLRIANVGTAPMQLGRTTMTTALADLSLGAGVDAGTLAPGEARDVEVVFQARTEGEVTGTIQVLTNDVLNPVVTVNVKGSAEGPKLCLEPAEGLDFGDVPMASTRKLPVYARNCGLVAFNLTAIAITEPDMNNRRFTTGAIPVLPASLSTGATASIEVAYSPKTQLDDTATLKVTGGGRAVEVPLKGKGAPSLCDVQPTIANAGADLTARPLDTVTLNGNASSSPRGGTLTYLWRLASQPTNGTSGISGSGARPTLYAQLAGQYTVELVVRDANGCQSAADTVVVNVVPNKRVHVQITWPQAFGDVDAHYVAPGGAFWSTSTDAYFANKRPSWGATLDIDEQWGHGPENINHGAPADGTYNLWVHYYCSRECDWIIPFVLGTCSGSRGAASPLAKIFIDGVEKFSASKSLTQRDKWNPARVVVSGGGSRIDVQAVTGSNVSKSTSDQGCTSDGN